MKSKFLSFNGLNRLVNYIKQKADRTDIPTKTSALTNDSNFINQTGLEEYAQPVGNYATDIDINDLYNELNQAAATANTANQNVATKVSQSDFNAHKHNGVDSNKISFTDLLNAPDSVPTSRKINGKALSSDITLTAADVGASDASELMPLVASIDKTLMPSMMQIYSYNAPKKLLTEYRTAGTYTWEVPPGVYFIDVFLMGGGGSSAAAMGIHATSGGAAGYIKNIIKKAVIPGQKINVIVGEGAKAASLSSENINTRAKGIAGGTTSFDGVTALGGNGGNWNQGTYIQTAEPAEGSSPSGVSGGVSVVTADQIGSAQGMRYYVKGQGIAAVNVNDPGRTYGRGGKNGDLPAPICDVEVGSGGDGEFASVSKKITSKPGKPGCVMIYGYLRIAEESSIPYTTTWVTANQYMLTIPNYTGNTDGTAYWIRFHEANTSATVNMNANSLGNVRLYNGITGSVNPTVGQIKANSVWLVQYSGGAFRLVSAL